MEVFEMKHEIVSLQAKLEDGNTSYLELLPL